MSYFPPPVADLTGHNGETIVGQRQIREYWSPHVGPTGTSNDVRDQTSSGSGGTVNISSASESEWELAINTNTLAEVTFTSAQPMRPYPGVTNEFGFSIRIPVDMEGNQVAEWGLDDEVTGVGFGQNATGLFVYVRSGGTQTKVQQSSWNVDALGGLGPSGLSLNDVTTQTKFVVEFSSMFLGMIDFSVILWDGNNKFQKVVVHRWAPVSGAVDSAPFCPLRTHITNGGDAGPATDLYVGEWWFATQGIPYEKNIREVFQFRLAQTPGTSVIPGISTRRKTGDRNARAQIYLTGFDLIVSGADMIIKFALGSSLTGASFATGQTSASTTSTEMDISATAVSGGANKFEGIFGEGSHSFNFTGVDRIALPADQTELSMTMRTVSGTATRVDTVIRLAEEW